MVKDGELHIHREREKNPQLRIDWNPMGLVLLLGKRSHAVSNTAWQFTPTKNDHRVGSPWLTAGHFGLSAGPCSVWNCDTVTNDKNSHEDPTQLLVSTASNRTRLQIRCHFSGV